MMPTHWVQIVRGGPWHRCIRYGPRVLIVLSRSGDRGGTWWYMPRSRAITLLSNRAAGMTGMEN